MNAEMEAGTDRKARQINLDSDEVRDVCRDWRGAGSGAQVFSGGRSIGNDCEDNVGLRHDVQ